MISDAQPDRSAQLTTVQSYREIEALIPPNWSEGDVVANGVRHHYYRTGGDKPPLVLLHGFLEGALAWLRTARALEHDYDIVMVDARGHGRSDRMTSGYSQELLTEDAAGVIRALELGKPRVLGFSQGGTTGIHLADAYPDLVHALIVEGAAAGAIAGPAARGAHGLGPLPTATWSARVARRGVCDLGRELRPPRR
jgi:pimeloyl-ACP methyl ester carboxylesterase